MSPNSGKDTSVAELDSVGSSTAVAKLYKTTRLLLVQWLNYLLVISSLVELLTV